VVFTFCLCQAAKRGARVGRFDAERSGDGTAPFVNFLPQPLPLTVVF
jgi:hypothetical protein